MINDTGLNRLAAIPEFVDNIERTDAIQSLQNRLEAIRSSNRYIQGVNVHIPAVDRTIQAVGKINVLDRAHYKRLMAVYEPARPVNEVDGEPVMIASSAYLAYKDEGCPLFLIELRLSRDAFREALAQFGKSEGSGAFLYAMAYGRFLADLCAGLHARLGDMDAIRACRALELLVR